MRDGQRYVVGRELGRFMWVALLVSLPWLYSPHWWRYGPWFSLVYFLFLIVVLVGLQMAVVVHELGHLAAALAVGAKVQGFRIGAENALFRVNVRGFRLVIGSPLHGGAVHYVGVPSVWKRVSITLAGPLADLVFAGVVLAVRLPVMPSFTYAFAATLAVVGLRNLMPMRTRAGGLSDGARLLSVRADVRAQEMGAELLKFTRGTITGGGSTDGASQDQDPAQVKRILAAYRKGDRRTRASIGAVASTLRNEKRTGELMELHRGLDASPGLMSAAESSALVSATLSVSFMTYLSTDDAELAQRRLDTLFRYHELDPRAEALAHVSLAILQLRRGQYHDVERLCRSALTLKTLPLATREVTLAMVIVARQALRQPCEDVYAEAVALGRDADHAVLGIRVLAAGTNGVLADFKEFEANPNGSVQPERTNRLLAAYRDGDPVAGVGAGYLGRMLRDEGRIAELLELHSGLSLPAGRLTAAFMKSLAYLEDTVAGVPGLPAEVYELTATRVQWLLDNYPFDGKDGALQQAGTRHTLAVVRLRQGRFDEVEPLCADAMANTSLSVGDRAQVLATIALARRGQGQPYEDLLAQAISLAPDDYLVKQAVAATAVGQSS